MILPQAVLERALERLLERVRARPELARDYAASLAEFSASTGALPGESAGHAARMAERRHAEWYLLERESPALDSIPAISLGDDDDEDARADWSLGADSLLGSFASVFEVTGVSQGEGVWVRDLAGAGEYPLEEADASHALEGGDLLVGRIFPVGDALYRISHASGFFRDAELLAAVRRDLDHAREGRRGVLRLSQRELETMFFGAARSGAAAEPGLSPIARAREVLARGGLDEGEIEDVLAELASDPFDPRAILPGAGDRLGAILETLAFETHVDLDAARRVLADAWPELSRPPERREKARAAADAAGAGADPVRKALSEFDARRASGGDLEASFAALEQALELEPDGGEDDAVAPDFPGVVGAMVVEFLWEMERERGAAVAQSLASIAHFAQFAADRGVFENLGEKDLLMYACLWIPEHAGSSAEARRWLDSLVAFASWAEQEQGVALARALDPTREGLARALPRIADANARLAAGPGAHAEGGKQAGGEMVVYSGGDLARSVRGNEIGLRLTAPVAERLQPGDFLRVAREADGRFRVRCVYPPETARLGEIA